MSVRPAGALLLTALLAATSSAVAQTGGGSSYSIFNIGDIVGSSTAASAGRGGVETAVPTPLLVNSVNPAGWSDLRMVTIQAGLAFDQYRVSDASSSLSQNVTRVREFAFGFPFSEDLGGSVALQLRPYSVVNYRTQLRQTIPTIDTTSEARITYSGRGGLSRGSVGASIRPIPQLAIGVSGNLYFGSITTQNDVGFSGSLLNPGSYRNDERYFGVGATVGMTVDPVDDLRIGASVDLGSSLDRTSYAITELEEGSSLLIDTTATSESTLSLPPRITAGLSWRTGRFLLAADAALQSWSDELPNARSSMRAAVGVDRVASSSLNAEGFERWDFRFGAYFGNTYYDLSAGGIDEYGLTLGARWPIGEAGPLSSSTVIDMGVELGKRGTTDNGLTQESYAKLYLGLSLNEIWFQRRR